jgi:16S rRNA (guanine(527)-N(7))-methyltransferase RsmG
MNLDPKVVELAAQCGCGIDADTDRLIATHLELVRKWNESLSLVSSRDVDNMWTTHVIDALSLSAPIAHLKQTKGSLLDIGSGGGFPGLILACALPSLSVCLVERSERKAHFLKHAACELSRNNVSVVQGEFPFAVRELEPNIVTARAVEKPEKIHKSVFRFMAKDAVFFCQSPEIRANLTNMFHVEQWQDEWSRLGLRRGHLWIVRRKG